MTNSRLKWNSCERDSCRLEALINRILVHFHSSIRLFTFLDLFIYSIFIYLRFLCLLTFLYLFTFSHSYSYLFIFIFIYLHIPVELTFDLTGATNKYDKIFTNTRSLETLLLNWSRARGEKRGCGSVLIGEESHGICFRVRGKARDTWKEAASRDHGVPFLPLFCSEGKRGRATRSSTRSTIYTWCRVTGYPFG